MKRLILIAAAGENQALGKDNALIWHLPDDFRRFKALTTGHKIIMGRKTLESFDRPLPDRKHIVITRDRDYEPKFPAQKVHSLEAALALVGPKETAYIIGGGEIYAQAMDLATDIELTRIHERFEADTFFPEIDPQKWELVKETHHPQDERHPQAFTYLTYTRRTD